MSVALLSIELRLPFSHSLKDKRRVIQSIFAKIKKNFNVSIAELDSQDLWQKANIEIASVNTSSGELSKTFNHIVDFIYEFHDVEVVDYKIENL
ncbi:MAG TPA: DUF503 domain-containing protein [Caldisericia bacterium]|nr:DUF503 domain-containing protein [Caldisericia bacterium]HPO28807.1 DUF503 domain-containing protein [Caldisericia bacterium]